MQERIRIRFTRDGAPLPVSRLDANAGLVFAYESSAEPLGFGIGLVRLSQVQREHAPRTLPPARTQKDDAERSRAQA